MSSSLFRLNTLRYSKRPKKSEPKYGKTILARVHYPGKISAHPLWQKGSTVVIKISSASQNLHGHLIYTQVMRGENGKENPLWNDKDDLNRKEFLKKFRGKGHQKYYKLMISPEKVYDEDEIKRIVKKCMTAIKDRYHDEPVYGAVIHRKPRGLHAHVVIRSKTKKERYIDFRKSTHLLKHLKLLALEEMARLQKEKEMEKKAMLEIDDMVFRKVSSKEQEHQAQIERTM